MDVQQSLRQLAPPDPAAPDRILRRFEARRKQLGTTDCLVAFRFAGVPYDVALNSQKLFAAEVLPVLKQWQAEDDAHRAA